MIAILNFGNRFILKSTGDHTITVSYCNSILNFVKTQQMDAQLAWSLNLNIHNLHSVINSLKILRFSVNLWKSHLCMLLQGLSVLLYIITPKTHILQFCKIWENFRIAAILNYVISFKAFSVHENVTLYPYFGDSWKSIQRFKIAH